MLSFFIIIKIMSIGSVTVLYAGKLFDQKFLLLGENHSIRDGESEIVASLRRLKKHCEFFFEQDPVDKICNDFSTLDKLACSRKIADYNLSSCCNIDFRRQFVKELFSELFSIKDSMPILYTRYKFAMLVYFLKFRPTELIDKYTELLYKYIVSKITRTVDLNLLRNCCQILWNVLGETIIGVNIDDMCTNYNVTRIILTDTGRLSPGACDNLLRLKIIPVHECIVMYLILKNQFKQKTIVYVAGESHVKWLVRSMEFYTPRYVHTEKPNNLDWLDSFVHGDVNQK